MRSARALVFVLLGSCPNHVWSLGVSNTGTATFAPLAICKWCANRPHQASIKSSAQLIAQNILTYYPANSSSSSGQPIGTFGSDYSWGEAGAVWGGLIDYWALTGDSQFNDQINAALVAQSGLPNTLAAFLPSNQTSTEVRSPLNVSSESFRSQLSQSNSDQALWALACMSAAENSFPGDVAGTPYITVAENVFSQQVAHWTSDSYACGGGLRELIQDYNQTLYSLKDTLSAGTFFQLAARLAIQTHNNTYTNWAQNAWNWATAIGLVNTNIWAVYNTLSTTNNCSISSLNQAQWSAASATFLYGSSLMYNLTNSQFWVNAVQGFLATVNTTFFQQAGPDMLSEPACNAACTAAQQAYLALAARWVAATGDTAPFTTAAIQSLLQGSAAAVAANCDAQGACTVGGQTGLSQALTALDSVDVLLLGRAAGTGSSPTTSASASPSPTKSGAGAVEVGCWGLVLTLFVVALGW